MYQISIHKKSHNSDFRLIIFLQWIYLDIFGKVNAFTIIYMLSIIKLSIFLPIAYIASLNMTSVMIISIKSHKETLFQPNHIVSLNEFDLQQVATKTIDMFQFDVISV